MADEDFQPDTGADDASAPELTPEQQMDAALRESIDEFKVRGTTRGDDGRFQPKVVAEEAPEGIEVPGSTQGAPPDPQPVVIEAPQSLPADVKAKWGQLPPDVQKYWADREGEVHRKLTADGERIKALSVFEEALSPHLDRIHRLNVAPHQYIADVLRVDQALAGDPVRFIQWAAHRHGIDLRSLVNDSTQQAPQQQQQPAAPQPTSAFDPRIHHLETRLSQMERADEQARLAAANQTIETFRKDRPHFDEALPLMSALIESKAAKGLDDAYDMAIHASPDIRAKIEATKAKEAADKAAKEAKEKAAKDARIAPFAKRPGSAPTAPAKMSWEDTMRDELAKIRSRAT